MNHHDTVLFVTYGGGHAGMVVPVARALQDYNNISVLTLALTSAGPIFRNADLPYLGYRDLLKDGDEEAIRWGANLAATHHSAESGIDEEESIAYLGLSFWDLLRRHGHAEAERLFQERGRQSFLPLSVMERAIDRYQPAIVVTTGSPRSEHAAIEVAKRCGIPTLTITDLLGIYPDQAPTADYVTVLTESAIGNIKQYGANPNQTFLVTGNPAFDPSIDLRGPIDVAWRRSQFPSLPERAKVLLWLDTPGYYEQATGAFHLRNEEAIVTDLDQLAEAAKDADAFLLIRPHPSQARASFDKWLCTTKQSHVLFAGGIALHPLLKAIDAAATYSSTVGCEAVLMQRPVIQLNYHGEGDGLPLGKCGLARLVNRPEDLRQAVRETLSGQCLRGTLEARAAQLFPQEKAAPKIAAYIRNIVSNSAKIPPLN